MPKNPFVENLFKVLVIIAASSIGASILLQNLSRQIFISDKALDYFALVCFAFPLLLLTPLLIKKALNLKHVLIAYPLCVCLIAVLGWGAILGRMAMTEGAEYTYEAPVHSVSVVKIVKTGNTQRCTYTVHWRTEHLGYQSACGSKALYEHVSGGKKASVTVQARQFFGGQVERVIAIQPTMLQ